MLHQLPPAATPALVETAATCPDRGSRNCFPELAPRAGVGRGSGRIYRVAVGGRINGEFVLDYGNVEVPDAFLGLGNRDAIAQAAADRFPGLDLIDVWPVAAELAFTPLDLWAIPA